MQKRTNSDKKSSYKREQFLQKKNIKLYKVFLKKSNSHKAIQKVEKIKRYSLQKFKVL